MKTAYTHGTIYTSEKKLTGKAILVTDGVIEDIVDSDKIGLDYTIKDLGGLNIAPAFIDLQIYGGNGKLFSANLDVPSIQATYEYCLKGGCAQFMITMATNTIEIFLKGMEIVRRYWEQGGKGLLGLHLEGPYINPAKKGAHLADCIKRPTITEVKMLLDQGRDVLKMMTLAPEVCDTEIIELLMQNGIIVSAGHTNATYVEAKNKFAIGIPTSTHLFNAMSPLQSRAPGMVGALYNDDKIKASIVADGIHVDFAAVSISKKIMGERLFFITDAVTATSQGAYQHVFTGDRYTLPDGTLSGSALTMMKCVSNAVNHCGISLDEALRMASTYPAQLLTGNKILGKIAKGFTADFVVFDDALNVNQVITNG
ncbi:MAG: N-acetylglucosamine-6-phosphate deacetylase [Bacteroidetes bacterium]|nr:N-acetylglucosamine-6-phosphate deacetylase [Bacteroidota bacterium]